MKTINRNLINGLAPGILAGPITATPAVAAVQPLPAELPDEARHTPGPWMVGPYVENDYEPAYFPVERDERDENGFLKDILPLIAKVTYGATVEEKLANARLIASAPALLASHARLVTALEKSETAMAALLSAAVLTPRAVVNHPPFKAGIDLTDDALYDCRAALAAAKGQP